MQTLTGFLLTRQWRDTRHGLELSFWAHSEQGPLRIVCEAQEAVCFIARSAHLDERLLTALSVSRRPLPLTSLNGQAVDGLYCKTQRDLNSLREQASEQGVALLESDIKASDRYLMERFITAAFELRGTPIARTGYTEYRNPVLRRAHYLPQLKTLCIDIETSDLVGDLYSIAVLTKTRAEVFMVGQDEGKPASVPLRFFTDERAAATLLRMAARRRSGSDPGMECHRLRSGFSGAKMPRPGHPLRACARWRTGGHPAPTKRGAHPCRPYTRARDDRRHQHPAQCHLVLREL